MHTYVHYYRMLQDVIGCYRYITCLGMRYIPVQSGTQPVLQRRRDAAASSGGHLWRKSRAATDLK